jgi:hypothetical protein
MLLVVLVFTIDTEMISKNSQVIVKRIPSSGKGLLQSGPIVSRTVVAVSAATSASLNGGDEVSRNMRVISQFAAASVSTQVQGKGKGYKGRGDEGGPRGIPKIMTKIDDDGIARY